MKGRKIMKGKIAKIDLNEIEEADNRNPTIGRKEDKETVNIVKIQTIEEKRMKSQCRILWDIKRIFLSTKSMKNTFIMTQK